MIAALDTDDGPLSDRAAFYVQISRTRDNAVALMTAGRT